jgi:hypothetical protein
MDTVQFQLSCPKCGNTGFNQPENPGPQDVAKGLVSCAACGHALTVEDVAKLKAAVAQSVVPADPVSAALAKEVRDIFKIG